MLIKSHFITIEGIEGTGKSTIIPWIIDYIKSHKHTVLQTREPGGTLIAEKIRQIVLANESEEITKQAELLLMFAGRSQHIENVIKPALNRGEWVVSDRFVDASYAYQGYGRGVDLNWIEKLDHFVCESFKPNLTILLDVPIEVALSRIKNRGGLDRIEKEKIEFFDRVRQGYLERALHFPTRIKVIDASKDLEVVRNEIWQCLEQYRTKNL